MLVVGEFEGKSFWKNESEIGLNGRISLLSVEYRGGGWWWKWLFGRSWKCNGILKVVKKE